MLYVQALVFSLLCIQASSIDPIKIVGHRFWNEKTGKEFMIKGMAYQPRVNDVIIDPITNERVSEWSKDLVVMKELGINVVRVYEVNSAKSHDAFMAKLQEYGMYLVLDIGQGQYSINRESPRYNMDLLDRYKRTIDTFSQYENVLGFFAGNEVMNAPNTTAAAPYMKALIRDLKAYVKTKPRYIPIGYSSNDDPNIRLSLWDYLMCGESAAKPDFYGVNIYSWCGNSDFQRSGYKDRTKELEKTSIPIILSEIGCNVIAAIYGPEMRKVFTGAIFYELTEESNGYGLIQNPGQKKLADYEFFKVQISNVKDSEISLSTYSAPAEYHPKCPEMTEFWNAVPNLPPTPNECVCSVMRNSLACVTLYTTATPTRVIGAQLSTVCGMMTNYQGSSACSEVSPGQGSLGNWGRFSMCADVDQLSYSMNQYFMKNGKDACDFRGTAKRVNPKNSLDLVSSCAGYQGSDGVNPGTRSDAKHVTCSLFSAFVALLLFAF